MIHGMKEVRFLEFFAESPIGALSAEAMAIPAEEITDETLGPVKEGEEVVGEMSAEERLLEALFRRKVKEVTSLQEQFRASSDGSPEKRDLAHRLSIAEREMKIVPGLMWFSILQRLPETAKTSSSGIRKGFKVVNFEEGEICPNCGKRHSKFKKRRWFGYCGTARRAWSALWQKCANRPRIIPRS